MCVFFFLLLPPGPSTGESIWKDKQTNKQTKNINFVLTYDIGIKEKSNVQYLKISHKLPQTWLISQI